MKTIGERIKELREEKGINQLELSKILNVHKGSVSNWENNKRTPDADMLTKIADFFNCSVDYLLGNTDIKNKLNMSKLFSGAGGLKLDSFKELIEKDESNDNTLFSFMLQDKLKEAGLYNENMSNEEKNNLANKILDILKIMQKK
ncbi:helix-turn-helix transcriptional regulator [Clostridium botulinum]|uniref:DNA-binding phage protein n=1 Tax=Clostridium botulinum (strain Hall / ATCC 3502 / NCTC 13319 / Type A) TaxID=441771 RepID=A5I4G6_CLOBH|nr:helix-turn-helix transcriptional regulator [Clostridium botulinum]NFL69718.1 helix-turn-helix transcriptional regulator [Clostridium botulinum]NFQ54165.1 helix-turn-helix transcriptional regulator [Clostridium botulinum]NFT46524.1 helix-turn-helix transcriptional regulator [Clostridium botulinum]QGT45355.1 HTH-type transcriptional regulator ImmR [Clostridium botulinum]CAL83938.1 putative DNA-binding phage protein [Clostridium botulinum A str. ATCC 3502]